MLLRGRSRDDSKNRKVTPPSPSYMSNDQFANYLADLRNNRVARPSGARPPPPSTRNRTEQNIPARSRTPAPPAAPTTDLPPRSGSALGSYTRTGSALSNHTTTSRVGRPLVQQPRSSRTSRDYSSGPPLNPSVVVPSATYIERGQRWMEKEEATALREAMEDLDLQRKEEEEAKLFAGAQAEASELVYQHQTGSRPQSPEKPYNYKDHLRKHSYAYARAESIKRNSIDATATGSGSVGDRRYTGSSTGSELGSSPESVRRPSIDRTRVSADDHHKSHSGGDVRGSMGRRRRSSGRRNISGEIMKSVFTGSQIWEEPGEGEDERGRPQPPSVRSKEARGIPTPLTLTEKNKVQFAPEPVIQETASPMRKFHRQEIYKNEPTQSRDPAYTVNNGLPTILLEEGEKSPTKNGIEIRSDDIRQATSMKLKDRSSKLPTPVIVSDKPGRPIVSFDVNWKPSESDVEPEEHDNFNNSTRFGQRSNTNWTEKSLPAVPTAQTVSAIPTIHLPDAPKINLNGSFSSGPTVPTFNFEEASAVPTIGVHDAPSISISGASDDNIATSPTKKAPARALPDPKTASSRPAPRQIPATSTKTSQSHWSTAGSRATVSCHQCELQVGAGAIRIEGQRFHPECIICYQCGTPLGHMDIRGEPDELRGPRLERLKRREAGEIIPDVEGETVADDGDERLRFYCHLDWHELFAPRCHHCKTPIEGTVQSAMGHLYHPGHFFCAECGDPFEAGSTHIEKDGYAWCVKCQTQRTERRAPKCKKCKKAVIGDYVEAMGGEWHADCFRCKNCNGEFDERGIFAREIAGEQVAFCVKCMEKEWKS